MMDGEALGIPGVFLFTQIAAYNRLTGQGRTSWDARNRIDVRHQELGMYRILGILLIAIVVIFIRMGRGGN